MNMTPNEIAPHPSFLETLFAYQDQVSRVFKDVLGLYDISHIAIAHVNNQRELLTFSSTPSIEFNLFSSNLWRFDKSYQARWYRLCTLTPWQSLYTKAQFDELYYLKQVKPQYPLGLSFAKELTDYHVIFSIASHKNSQHTQELFMNQHENFYKIGMYCSNLLLPITVSNFLSH